MSMSTVLSRWTSFPPSDERARLERYVFYKMLLTGEHREAFASGKQHKSLSETSKVLNAASQAVEKYDKPYIILNYCKTVATTFASKMFGITPEYRVNSDGTLPQERLNKIVRDNTLDNTNIEQAISSVALGDCVYRVRWGQMRNWREPLPIIEAVPSKNYFAITPEDNVKDNASAVLAFCFEYGGVKYLKTEEHAPYMVRHELWSMTGNEITAPVAFDTVPMFANLLQNVEQLANVHYDDLAVVEETGYPGLFVEYVPNFVLPDEFYGRSDYENLASIQHDINETNTGILQVILKHIDPKLILPPGTLKYDERSGNWYVVKEDLEVVEVPKDVGAVLPRYLTWDAQLSAARENAEALFEAFMILADISLPILGITKYGTAESAAALELKMTQTIDAVNRKRMYFDTALKNILYAAQHIDSYYGGQSYTPFEVSIEWPSPVPLDRVTQTDILSQQVGAGIKSRRKAVGELQSLEGEVLDQELDEILDDRASSAVAFADYGNITGAAVTKDDDRSAG